MSIRTDHEKEFISLFNSIARGTRRLQVFTDFISCSVIAIQNGLQFCDKREKKVSVSPAPSCALSVRPTSL